MAQVSVLMLDIQGSTPLSRSLGGVKHRDAFMPEFDRIVAQEIKTYEGLEFQRQEQHGDDCKKAFFGSPRHAVACAVSLQNRFRQFGIPVDGQEVSLALHLAIHTCRAMPDGTPDTSEIPLVARIMARSTGGQILLSAACYDAYRQEAGPSAYTCQPSGEFQLKGIPGLHRFYNVQYDDQYRGEPGTGLMDYALVEAANQYIARPGLEQTIRDTFTQTVGRGGNCRFVTIYGEGGMGKTRLAVNCAKQMTGDFPGGIAWVPLAFVTNPAPEIVADAILSGLHLKPEPGDLQAQIQAHLKTRPATLLLLDNAETIATCEPVIAYLQTLLAAVPQVRFLVTSRRPIGLHAQETTVDVNDGLTAREAFQLFGVRANSAFRLPDVSDADLSRLQTALAAADHQLPPGAFTEPEQDTLRLLRLFHLANHNTLALELIASWTHKYQTPRDLIKNYEAEAFSLLTEISDGVPSGDEHARERHSSLEASYHWSWKNLGQEKNGHDAQSAFLAAALFATTFTDESVGAVLGWKNNRRTSQALGAVQNAALIRPDATSGTTRYRMHWQLQEYGRDERFRVLPTANATLPTQATLRSRFVAYYDQRTDTHGREQVFRSAESRVWMTSEWRNVLVAASYAEAAGTLKPAVWLRLRLVYYFKLMGRWRVWEQSGYEAHNVALQTVKASGQKFDQAATLNNLGSVYHLQGKWSQAAQAHEESLGIFRDLGNRHSESGALCNLGNVYRSQAKWSQAKQHLLESLDIFRDLGDQFGQGMLLGNLGSLYGSQAQWVQAEQCYTESLNIRRHLGDQHGQGVTLCDLGAVYQTQGKLDQAERCYLESLGICRDLGDRNSEGSTLRNLAALKLKQGRWREAGEYARQGLVAASQTEDTGLTARLEETIAACRPTLANLASRLVTAHRQNFRIARQILVASRQSDSKFDELIDQMIADGTLPNKGLVFRMLSYSRHKTGGSS